MSANKPVPQEITDNPVADGKEEKDPQEKVDTNPNLVVEPQSDRQQEPSK